MQELGLAYGGGQFVFAPHPSVSCQYRVQAANSGTVGHGHPGGDVRENFYPASLQGPCHREHGVFEDRRTPGRLVPGRKKRVVEIVDGGNLTGNPDREILAEGKTGQRADTTFAGKGLLPLAFQIIPQRGNGIIADNDCVF